VVDIPGQQPAPQAEQQPYDHPIPTDEWDDVKDKANDPKAFDGTDDDTANIHRFQKETR
jgi:hypothetical protein